MFPGPISIPLDFYAWVPAADAPALRTSKELFGHGKDPRLSTRLSTLTSVTSNGPTFVATLQNQFGSGYSAWRSPWANRMLVSSGSAALVHVELRAQARLAVIEAGGVTVYDSTRTAVPSLDAEAHPELIGAIYFDDSLGSCSFFNALPERGFVIGNPAMVQEWSLGTPELLQRIQTDIQDLSQFLIKTRDCPPTMDEAVWSQSVPCSWPDAENAADAAEGRAPATAGAPGAADAAGAPSDFAGAGGAGAAAGSVELGSGGVSSGALVNLPPTVATGLDGTERFAYGGTLVVASPDYFPEPEQIGAIIDTLQGDLFEPDPLIVTPGSP